MFRRDALAIESSRGPFHYPSVAKAHERFANPCRSNSVIVGIDAAAIDSIRGKACTSIFENDHTVFARFWGAKCQIFGRAEAASAFRRGAWHLCSAAIAHAVVERSRAWNSLILPIDDDEIAFRKGKSAQQNLDNDHAVFDRF